MANDAAKVQRIMHLKMRTPTADASQILALLKPAIPFFETWGGRVRLLQNVDDPAQFLQIVEYETDAALELNRHRIASDPTMRTYLQTWRTLLGGAADIDVYEDVTNLKT
jgi:hypothetical protein